MTKKRYYKPSTHPCAERDCKTRVSAGADRCAKHERERRLRLRTEGPRVLGWVTRGGIKQAILEKTDG